MFGFDLDHGDHTFDDGWFDVTWFMTCRTLDAILGHIFVLDEIYRSWWSCMFIPTCKMYAETMTCSPFLQWFLSGASREPSSYARTSWHLDAIMLFHLKGTSWICGYDSVIDSDDQDYIFVDGWFDVIWYSQPVTHSMLYWGIFPF